MVQPGNVMLRNLLPRSLVCSGGLFVGNTCSTFLLRSDLGQFHEQKQLKKSWERGMWKKEEVWCGGKVAEKDRRETERLFNLFFFFPQSNKRQALKQQV